MGLAGASVAEAQLRVVVADGDVTPLGEVRLPHHASIDDGGAVAFMATLDGADAAMVWRNGTLAALATAGDPAPCGTGTISGIGDGLGGLESVALRGLWATFDIHDSLGVQRRIGSNDGTLRCMASSGDATAAGSLARFNKYPITNEAGEVLVDDSHLWLVPNAGGSYGQVAGAGTSVPVPPMHTAGPARYWLLDDDGDVTVAIQTSYLGGDRLHALHGRPGAMTLIEPLGLGAMDTFTLSGTNGPMIGVTRDGSVAYEAYIEPPSPAVPYYAMWAGAPGATSKQVEFPVDAGGVTLTRLYARPHVVSSSHLVAEVMVESSGAPRQALVRWISGTPTVIATTGEPLPGHPLMMVQRFGGVGVDAAGTIFVQVLTGAVTGGIYRIPVGGAIEKVLATGDTLSIAGVDETIRGTRFDTTFGTGYGTMVSATGGIVFSATYQDGAKLALVTQGTSAGPAPDLVLELISQQPYKEDPDPATSYRMELRITNVGAGASEFPVLRAMPDEYFFCPTAMTQEPGACVFDRLEPGASVMKTVFWDSTNDYRYMMEVSSDGQEDADPSNNVLSGPIEIYVNDACGTCASSGSRPLGWIPLLLAFALVLRARR